MKQKNLLNILIHVLLKGFFVPSASSQSHLYLPVTASDGSSLCAIDNPMLYLSVKDIYSFPPEIPNTVRCGYMCNQMNNDSPCLSFNIIDNKLCQLYSSSVNNCVNLTSNCIHYQVRKLFNTFHHLL
jgi:hypothetical protein